MLVELVEAGRRIVTPNGYGNKKNHVGKKTEIEIELIETVAYGQRGERCEKFCSRCAANVEMAATQTAAILTHKTEREIYRLVEAGEIHFVETDRVLVCLKSFVDLNGEI